MSDADKVETPTGSKCKLCEKDLAISTTYKTKCGHDFHKTCITSHSKTHRECPICGIICFQLPPSGKTIVNSPAPSGKTGENRAEVDIGNLVTQAVQGMKNDLLTQLSQQMAQIIQANIAALVPGNPLAPPNPSTNTNWTDQERQPVENFDQFRSESRFTPVSVESDAIYRPDRVGQILNSWKIRFNGSLDGISVDNFIYRVEALTEQTLNSKFEILASNASLLFDGKARDFYWRYHKSCNGEGLDWKALCQALRKQFRDTRSDVDIREAIRDRKQKEKENFDTFHEAIVSLTDGLEVPLSEKSVAEILARNLRPEIRHELLHIQINSVGQLREICRRRESFLEDVRRNYAYTKATPYRKQVAELLEDPLPDEAAEFSDIESEVEVGALALICWNCHKEGHRYQDCEGKRRIFCYSCGKPNTYKPSCSKCQKNAKGYTQPRQRPCVQRHRPTNSEAEQ
ncbi:uncharacterized protein LOC108148614 isoform X3 [Drosophila elegans]|uniref:uncharacterized protein LOC108148614 isoform X3 n=1 Tax=Drosophila elegans TaxID=30023 RepID=UPI001BC847AB|nr:uncharacterized protein LOC108148614 isoform X3 [Drosophila elegans]